MATVSLAMLGAALWARLGGEVACQTPSSAQPSTPRP